MNANVNIPGSNKIDGNARGVTETASPCVGLPKQAYPNNPGPSTCIDPDEDIMISNHTFSKMRRKPPGFDGKRQINDFISFSNVREFDISLDEVDHSGDHRASQRKIKRNSSESFDFNASRKDFLDEVALLEYDGKNMLFIMFENQIVNLMKKCPYDDKKFPLLRASCVREALQTIAIVISDSPALNSTAKVKMASDRLPQRFGVSGGFLNEPEVRQIKYGLRLTSTSAGAWREFRDQLTQCYVFVHSYNHPEKLEGRLVIT